MEAVSSAMAREPIAGGKVADVRRTRRSETTRTDACQSECCEPIEPKNPVTTAGVRASRASGVRADVVVIGVFGAPDDGSGKSGRRSRTDKAGKERHPSPGAGDVVEAFGKGFVESLEEIGVSTKVGETCKLPSGGKVKAPMS